MTRPRKAILPAMRSPMPILAAIAVSVAGALGGCATTPAAPTPPSRPAASVLALPSTTQLALAGDLGMPASRPAGRRDVVLGGPVIEGRGPSLDRVDVRSDQRVVNGRVYGTVWWRSRSVGVRSR